MRSTLKSQTSAPRRCSAPHCTDRAITDTPDLCPVHTESQWQRAMAVSIAKSLDRARAEGRREDARQLERDLADALYASRYPDPPSVLMVGGVRHEYRPDDRPEQSVTARLVSALGLS